jgi:hypothetical protein
MAQGIGPEFKPQQVKKTKRKKKRNDFKLAAPSTANLRGRGEVGICL